MVKRPMPFILMAYIAGSCLYEKGLCFVIIISIVLLSIGCIAWEIFSRNRQDRILVMVPIFFLLGWFLMGRQQQPAVLDDILSENAITVSCQGVVAEIQSTANSNRILLDEVVYGEEVTTAKKISSQVKSKYIIIYSSDITNLHVGNHINVYGKLSSFTVPTNLGQFDEQFYYKIQNIDYKMMAQKYEITDASINYIKDAMFQLRKKMCSVYELAATEDTKGSLQAMLLGEKGVLEEETKTLYQVGGISHVLAISGVCTLSLVSLRPP